MPPRKKRKVEYSKEVQRGRHYKQKKTNVDTGKEGTREQKGAGYADIIKENALFEKYYQGQGFISASEWPTFIATIKESLPATFRITGTRSLANHVLSCLKQRFFGELTKLEVDGEKVPPPTPLPWYPDNLAWNVPLTKKFIRKSPLMSKFHAFLVRENEQGNISRQEAVSMIPPLVLDIKPSHKVLDMCAAPGSKTAQLIELLHAEDSELCPLPCGVVVANDANNKRCYMLVHQAKRLNSPCFMVTNHDASVYPMLYYHDGNDVRHPVFYDRVLCDVPCSGDGTLRKNSTIWQSWTPLTGPSLHKLQLRILNRGLELLVPGGKLVYSTCSLNPIEDEAVIATALNLCRGAVELIDCLGTLAGLITLPGLTSWKAMSKDGEWLETYESIPESILKHFSPSMFPPKNSDKMDLEKCIRVLPHYQDSGGFFIAVLKKKEWLPWQSRTKTGTSQSLSTKAEKPVKPDSVKSEITELEISATHVEVDRTLNQDTCNIQDSVLFSDKCEDQDTSNIQESTTIGSAHVNRNSQESTAVVMDTASLDDKVEGSVPSDVMSTANKEELTDVKSPSKPINAERPSEKILGKADFQHRKGRGFKEDPYVFFEKDSDFLDTIKEYYGLSESFPLEQLLTRTRTGKKRNIYFSSKLVKELTIRNEKSVKIINIGVKVMSRCEHPKTTCNFRLCQEGVESLIPYIGNHCVMVEQADLSVLLKEANPLITSLTAQAQDDLQTLSIGPVVFVYLPRNTSEHGKGSLSETSSEISISCPLYLSGWLAAKSVRLYLDKNYRYHFLSMLGHEPPTNQCLDTMNSIKRSSTRANPEGVARTEEADIPEEEQEVTNDGGIDNVMDVTMTKSTEKEGEAHGVDHMEKLSTADTEEM